MTFIMVVFMLSFISGLIVIASNPSPYFGALGLVVASGVGCGVLVMKGGSFLALVLFLIYLGGMLVVFAYSAALASEPFPETLGSREVMLRGCLFMVGVLLGGLVCWEGWYGECSVSCDEFDELAMFHGDSSGLALMYSVGGWMLVVGAWVLLLTLFVVLELCRGLSRGSLRAV
uniref:NADH-ubiquinone oxidoreductase chain 6 n=1 Tax=Gobiomorus maculatus TaxID=308072 RepID=A0A343L980_9TELE|nr:NADH dehydrogenase subunit 6 [Gobiomorus maculatus]ATN23296.1 NADH dehydrogenase subunit 6 [Gobiomorus maculatus]